MSLNEVIKSVFQPAKESIGKRLFRKMKRNAKIEKNASLNLLLFEDVENKNNESITYKPKVDLHGLGYNEMLDSEKFLYSEKSKKQNDYVSATMSGGRKLKISGEAFGYGALEDNDDINVYNIDDMSQYDFEIGSIPRIEDKKRKFPNSAGSMELEGFAKSKAKINLFNSLKQKYKPPEVPKNWKPKKIKSKTEKKSRWDASSKSGESSTLSNITNKQPVLNANIRAVILGEEIVHKVGVAKNKKPSNESTNTELDFDKEISKTKATPTFTTPKQTPLTGFFASKFTRSSTSKVHEEEISAGLTTFKDLASITDLQTKPKTVEESDNVEKKPTRTVFEWHPHKILCKRFGVQNPYPLFPDIVGIIARGNDQRNATSRINNPKSLDTKKSLFTNLFQDLNNLNDFNSNISDSAKNQNVPEKKPKAQIDFKEPPPKIIDIDDDEDEDDDNEEINEGSKRPPMDLFKSIFASDDESEEENEEKESENLTNQSDLNQNQEENENSASKSKSSLLKSDGIFSGIDFDDLNQNFNPCFMADGGDKSKTENRSATIVEEIVQSNDDDDDECYGPALPPGPPVSHANTSEQFKNLIEKSLKHKKSKKKKKKTKKSTKKSKKKDHKKRRKRGHSESSNSTSSSDDDLGASTDNRQQIEMQLLDSIKKARHH